jgi:cell division protein FtsQ
LKGKLKIVAWALFAVAVIAVLFLARKNQNEAIAKDPNISISVVDENAFLTESELLVRLKRLNLFYPNQQMQNLNTTAIEENIRKMHEVEEVDVFKQLGGNWGIKLKVRQPYARIFNLFGESFYVDSKGATMNPSPNFTARILVFTGNIKDKSDTLLVGDIEADPKLKNERNLDEIFHIAKVIHQDPFLTAQIGQVHRDKWGDFILIPRVGAQRIVLGPASSERDISEKLKKLVVFYTNGLPYVGWNKYKTINLKYRNQVVCTYLHDTL